MQNYFGSWDANGAPVELSREEQHLIVAEIIYNDTVKKEIEKFLREGGIFIEKEPNENLILYPGGPYRSKNYKHKETEELKYKILNNSGVSKVYFDESLPFKTIEALKRIK